MGVSIAGLLVFFGSTLQAKPKTTKEKEDAIPIPPGHDARGVRIPFYDEDGRLQMFFSMEIATRLDPARLQMANLKIETYDESGKPDLGISMPVSLYDIGASVVSSAAPVTIHRSDFEMTGTHMTFNTDTRLGKFKGPARMVIFNTQDFAGSSQKHETTALTPGGTAQ